MKFHTVQSPPVPKTRISASARCSQTPPDYLTPLIRDHSSRCKPTGEIIFLYIMIFIIVDIEVEGKKLWTEM